MECEPRRLFSIRPHRDAISSACAGCKSVSSTLLASAALNLVTRIAIPVIVLNGVSGVAFAQDATWVGTTSDWNTPSNWNSNSVPTGTATFNPTSPTTITFSAPSTAVQNLAFNAPGYTFLVSGSPSIFSITGSGIQATPTNAPTFVGGDVEFRNSSTAGPAFIDPFGTNTTNFFDTSRAGTATINAGVQGVPTISTAVSYFSVGTALLITRGSLLLETRTLNFTMRVVQVTRHSSQVVQHVPSGRIPMGSFFSTARALLIMQRSPSTNSLN
jgi:hypothetical protein